MGRYWVVIVLAVISLAVGLVSRFWITTRPSSPWHYSKEKGYSQRSHYQDIPVLTTADAYWFTRYAKEHASGTYGRDEKDRMRQFPDGMSYPPYIPMISWITSCLHRITGMHIERVAFYLPPIVAVLFIIPLFAYSRYLGGPLPALGGALLGVTSLSYVVRSSVGRFDTDCMNLFFMFLIGYLIQRAGETVGKKGIILAGLAGISFWLFDWWYYHPAFIFPFTFVFAVLLLLNRKKDQRHYWLIKLGVFLLLANPLDYYTAGASILSFVWTYVYPQPGGYDFPNVIVSVTEAKHENLRRMFVYIHSAWASVLGLIGLAWLLIRTRTKFLGLLPTLLLGMVALKGGNRFIMFLAPFVGLGIGLLASQLLQLSYRWIKTSVPRGLAGALAVVVTMAVCISPAGFAFDPGPKFLGRTYKGFKHLAELNQPGAVWTWWDWGYAIEHIGEQATYTDGGSYDKAYYVGLALSQSDPQIAYNVMLGVNNIGRKGIYQQIQQRQLDSGREVIKELKLGKYNAQPKAPIYVVYTSDMLRKFQWIRYFGTWNFDRKRGDNTGGYTVLTRPQLKGKYLRASNGTVDLKLGLAKAKYRGKKTGLIKIESTKIIKILDEKVEPDVKAIDYKGHENTNVILQIVLSKTHGPMAYLMTNQTYESVFNQMFVLNKYDRRFFQLIYSDAPYVKILKVKTTGKASEDTVDQVLTTQQQLTDKE